MLNSTYPKYSGSNDLASAGELTRGGPVAGLRRSAASKIGPAASPEELLGVLRAADESEGDAFSFWKA